MLFTDVLDNAEDKNLWKNMAIDHSELKKKKKNQLAHKNIR